MPIIKRLHRSRQRRTWRVRNKIRGAAIGRLRLSVFRSNKHICAQVIDDSNGMTVVAASSAEKSIRADLRSGGNTQAAVVVGEKIGVRCAELGITDVIFDRGPYKYHGRIAALADSARKNGLNF